MSFSFENVLKQIIKELFGCCVCFFFMYAMTRQEVYSKLPYCLVKQTL